MRTHVGLTTYDAKDPATAYPPIVPLRPPAGAPNVVVVLLDDAGFGSSSAFGGPCRTPTFDRLAAGGLRFNRFHTTALCSPTRQALLTGRNHHAVGMGGITEIATSAPGYSSIRPDSAALLAEILKLNGYSTAQLGKCHEVPAWETSPMGPFRQWPLNSGFEYFYGFIGAETNQWHPAIYDGVTPVEPVDVVGGTEHLVEERELVAIAREKAQGVPAADRVMERGRDGHPRMAGPIPRVASEERRHPRPHDARVEVVARDWNARHTEHVALAIAGGAGPEPHDREVGRAAAEVSDEAEDLLVQALLECARGRDGLDQEDESPRSPRVAQPRAVASPRVDRPRDPTENFAGRPSTTRVTESPARLSTASFRCRRNAPTISSIAAPCRGSHVLWKLFAGRCRFTLGMNLPPISSASQASTASVPKRGGPSFEPQKRSVGIVSAIRDRGLTGTALKHAVADEHDARVRRPEVDAAGKRHAEPPRGPISSRRDGIGPRRCRASPTFRGPSWRSPSRSTRSPSWPPRGTTSPRRTASPTATTCRRTWPRSERLRAISHASTSTSGFRTRTSATRCSSRTSPSPRCSAGSWSR